MGWLTAMGSFFAACGVFTICAAALDWDWFMNHPKARLFVSLFGRNGARVLYVILGTVLLVLGVLMATGAIQDSR